MELSIDILRECYFFSGLNQDELSQIFHKLQRVDLSENEYLFKEREPGDSLYVLIQGKLVASTKYKNTEKIIGFIKRGEVVGELNIFSTTLRSASIKAMVPSVVLCLKREDFQSLCYKNPKILWEVTRLISKRSQSNIEILREGKTTRSQLIAVVSVGQQINIEKLFSELERNSYAKLNINFIKYSSVKSSRDLVDKVADSGCTTIYCMDCAELHKYKELLQLSDKVILTINAEYNDCDSLKKIWDECVEKNVAHLEKELMLLHDSYKISYPNTQQYLSLANFSRCYHVSAESPKTIQRMLRLLSGNAIGLVIGGGGARGWAAVGIIRALHEQNIPIDYIGGVSAGALVAAPYAISENYEQFINHIDQHKGTLLAWTSLTWPLVSIFSGEYETKLSKEVLGEIMISDLSLPYFVISANLSTMGEYVWDRGPLWQSLRASVSAAPLIPPLTYNHQIHIDGGLLNNFPVDVMNAKLENRGFIIGVDISSIHLDMKKYDFQPNIGVWRALQMMVKGTNYMSIMEIMDRAIMIASAEKTIKNSKKCDLLIRPNLENIKFTDFDKKDEIIEIGYEEADKQLRQCNWVKNLF